MVEIISKFSERLKDLMFDRQLTAESLSKAIGCDESSIYIWASGKAGYTPTVGHLVKLADHFKCSIDFLIGSENENYLPNPKPAPSFSSWFRNAVESKGFSLYRLEKKTNISTGNFYKWISGKREPSLDSLLRIAAVLDCSLDYLIGRE